MGEGPRLGNKAIIPKDGLLQLMEKGITVEQVSRVCKGFRDAGILVHAYLMFGFPTETEQETIDSLEVVRQLFENNLLQSAFWHRFAMTAHSPVGMYPEQFKVKALTSTEGSFAQNDLDHDDPTGTDHARFGAGLAKSLYNFMHGVCLDHPLQEWFDHKVPPTSLPADLIESYLSRPDGRDIKSTNLILWIGGPVMFDDSRKVLTVFNKQETIEIRCTGPEGKWLSDILLSMAPDSVTSYTYQQLQEEYDHQQFKDFTLFWFGQTMEDLKEAGLLVL